MTQGNESRKVRKLQLLFVVMNITQMFVYLFFNRLDGDEGIGQLFRVQDANLRARVFLQALERWPLTACLELLEFCLDDLSTDASLRTDLELKKKELDIYHRVIYSDRYRKVKTTERRVIVDVKPDEYTPILVIRLTFG